MDKLWRFMPVLLLLLVIAIVVYFGWYKHISLASLQHYRSELLAAVQMHYLRSVVLFILLYIAFVSLALPGPAVLTIAAGFLFGVWLGALYVIIAATIGATFIFWIVQFSIGHVLAQRANKWLDKLRTGFQHNAWQYLLFLRVVPLFPFMIINIIPGLLGIPVVTFVIATFVGIIPGTLVYAWLGSGLEHILAQGGSPDLGLILQPEILVPIIALACLALLPVLYKKLRRKR